MKQLFDIVQEKLVLAKTNKVHKYNYFPTNRQQLIDIIEHKYQEQQNIIDVSDIDITNVAKQTIAMVFCYMYELEEITGLDKWDVSGIKNLYCLFQNCENLKRIDISNWDVSNVERYDRMFHNCGKMESIGDISDWNIKTNADCTEMFKGCNKTFTDKYSKYFNI